MATETRLESRGYAHSDRLRRIREIGFDYAAQEREPVAVCDLCGAGVWEVLAVRDRYGFPATATACRACGLTMLNPRMTASAYAMFYRDVYRPLVSAYHGRTINSITIQAEQAAYAEQIAAVLTPLVRNRGYANLLDVGGSTGVVAAHLSRAFGLAATLIDPAPAEADVAVSLGLKAIVGFVEDWTPVETFDVIGMFQTIDHLMKARATLEKLRTVVSPGGLLAVDIVDFRSAYRRSGSIEEAVKADHVYSFTEMTARALLARCGFAPVLRHQNPDLLHVLYVCEPCQPDSSARPAANEVSDFFSEVEHLRHPAIRLAS